jgi:hypothetical protein
MMVLIKSSKAVLRIRDVFRGSEFFHPGSRVKKIPDPDPHQKFKYFNPKKSGLFNPDPVFLPIPEPGSATLLQGQPVFFVAGLAEFGTKVIFPRASIGTGGEGLAPGAYELAPGAYVRVRITGASSEVLKGDAVALISLASADS